MESRMMSLVLAAVLVALALAQTEVNMGSSSTICGSNKNLPRNEKLSVYSKGKAPDGTCTMVLNAIEDTDADCPHRAFCVAVTNLMMSTCSAKVFLTGTSYDVAGRNTKELSCYSNIYGAWCTQSKTLQISVLEDPKSTSSYGFNFTVLSECRTKPANGEFEPYDKSNSKKINEIQEEINQNRIIGVVVGCCLACMFLIILFISYNYYKNKPTYRQQRDI